MGCHSLLQEIFLTQGVKPGSFILQADFFTVAPFFNVSDTLGHGIMLISEGEQQAVLKRDLSSLPRN